MNKIFLHKLKKQLNEELPGIEAHEKMSPNIRFTSNFEHHKNATRESSVLILIYKKNNEFYIPFIKRPKYNGVHSGQISLPGGKSEPTDKNSLETALRETHEEIGINGDKIETLGRLTSIYIPNSNFNVSPFIGYLDEKPTFSPDTYEVEKIIEAPLIQLIDPNTIHSFKKRINGHHIEAPYYNINNHHIWGATAMIISELNDVIKKINFTSSNFYNAHNAPKSQ